jgi:hypothetical protein
VARWTANRSISIACPPGAAEQLRRLHPTALFLEARAWSHPAQVRRDSEKVPKQPIRAVNQVNIHVVAAPGPRKKWIILEVVLRFKLDPSRDRLPMSKEFLV